MLSHNAINDRPAHADGELMAQLRSWAKSDGMLLGSPVELHLPAGVCPGIASVTKRVARLSKRRRSAR